MIVHVHAGLSERRLSGRHGVEDASIHENGANEGRRVTVEEASKALASKGVDEE